MAIIPTKTDGLGPLTPIGKTPLKIQITPPSKGNCSDTKCVAEELNKCSSSQYSERASSVNLTVPGGAVQPAKLSDKAHFDLEKAKALIGNYELKDSNGNPKVMPKISDKSREALLEGCAKAEETPKNPRAKREEFLDLLHRHLPNTPPGKDKEVTTLLDFFDGDTDLLDAYKEAVAEERNSVEFREAVFTEAAEKRDTNPSPFKKMVMYIGGPSASGKSFSRKAFIKAVQNLTSKGTEQNKSECHIVSIDGGIDRDLCQMRQMVLQAATKNGYGGISDLHKHTKTGVKEHVLNAAMNEGNDFHVVIPATFINGLKKLTNMMKDLSKKENIYQVFTEIRADTTSDTSKTAAKKSFKETICYNGESRAYILENDENNDNEMTMNNRKIGCESKIYEENNFKWGAMGSSLAKKMFKGKGPIISNDSDNIHVNKNKKGEWVQTKEKPTVTHISQRELNLWNALQKGDTIGPTLEFKALKPEMSLKEFSEKTGTFMDSLSDKMGENENFDFPDFIKLLGEHGLRSEAKLTIEKPKERKR
ncbi:hypothetical protein N9Y92_02480 [Chlamydiales bacterium]|nr:hypothetical protein [Chlamydiales bacterium]